MHSKARQSIKTSYLDKKVWLIIALSIVLITAYLAYPSSFDSLVKEEGSYLKVMVISLDGSDYSDTRPYFQADEIRDRVFDILFQYKYRKEWSSKAKSYSEEKLIHINFGTVENLYTMQLVSNGDMIFSDGKSNENYYVFGGGKLFDEVYALIEAGKKKESSNFEIH